MIFSYTLWKAGWWFISCPAIIAEALVQIVLLGQLFKLLSKINTVLNNPHPHSYTSALHLIGRVSHFILTILGSLSNLRIKVFFLNGRIILYIYRSKMFYCKIVPEPNHSMICSSLSQLLNGLLEVAQGVELLVGNCWAEAAEFRIISIPNDSDNQATACSKYTIWKHGRFFSCVITE